MKLGCPSGIELAPHEEPIKGKSLDNSSLIWKGAKKMALILKGGEFIATEALSANMLAGLSHLARRRPLVINGLELHQQELAKLAEEAQQTGKLVWPQSCPTNFIS